MSSKEITLIDGVDGGAAVLVTTRVLYVVGIRGRDTGDAVLCKTVQGAINKANPGDVIFLEPATYVENVVIPKTKPGLTLFSPERHGGNLSPAAGIALTVSADDTTLVNLDAECDAGGNALLIYGTRVRIRRTKIEAGAVAASVACKVGPRTVANGGHGGADIIFDECEFGWADRGLQLVGTDYGAATQIKVRRCSFHNLAVAHLAELVGVGGSAAETFRNLEVTDCSFDNAEDGTAPTKFVDLAGHANNTGLIADNRFGIATNAAAKLAIAAGVKWVRNATEAGSSAARPA